LIKAAERIVGAETQEIEIISVSAATSFEEIKTSVRNAVEKFKHGGAVIFTDILGGSPTSAALPPAKDEENIAVISGVNLAMVISALSYRDKLSIKELAAKIVEDGKKSVQDVKAVFAATKNAIQKETHI
ncbi:MAG: hypothetical protein NTW04_02410, partial [Elusimicrobia bacterium]|nr:hypothetical protein [Elusimicrobiota bacterium]